MRRIRIEMPFPVPAQERYVPYDMMLNDIGFWYPVLKRSGVYTPNTIIVNNGGLGAPVKRIKQAMDEIGYPCFFRGGSIAASLKHQWENTCFVSHPLEESEILDRCYMVMNYCTVANQGAEPLIYENWAIREYINSDTVHTYRAMPLKKEIRVFIKDNAVACMHHYWDQQLPKELVLFSDKEIDSVYHEAEKVAKYFYGYWSCDFLLSNIGQWFAIDMALGEDSFHGSDCQKLRKGIVNAIGCS